MAKEEMNFERFKRASRQGEAEFFGVCVAEPHLQHVSDSRLPLGAGAHRDLLG